MPDEYDDRQDEDRGDRGKRPNRDRNRDSRDKGKRNPEPRHKKSFLEDIGEGEIDIWMGPFVQKIIDGIPERFFAGGISRRLLEASSTLARYASLAIARMTNAPQLVDNARTRFVAAWQERIKQRLAGEKPTGAPLDKKTERALGELADQVTSASNFISFLMQLEDGQLTSLYAGMQELGADKVRRLEMVFVHMNPKQLESVLRRIQNRPGLTKDWGLLFRIFEELGILGDEADETPAPKLQEAAILQTIMGLDDEPIRTTVIDFLAKLSPMKGGQYAQAIQRMVTWQADDYTRFAGLTDPLRAGLLGITLEDVTATTETGHSWLQERWDYLMKKGEEFLDHRREDKEATRRRDVERGNTLVTAANSLLAGTRFFNKIQIPTFDVPPTTQTTRSTQNGRAVVTIETNVIEPESEN